jgi:hypothetical protein
VRFAVVFISACAALTLSAASAVMNWAFKTSLGRTGFEQNILGAVSVAVSVLLAVLPALLQWAWQERRLFYMAVGFPVFAAFAVFSLSSAVGFAARNRGGMSEDRALASSLFGRSRREAAEAEDKLRSLAVSRPFTVIQALLRGMEQDRRWQISKSCEAAAGDASRAFCKNYFELKADEARSNEAAALEARLEALRDNIRSLELRGAGRQADDQAAVLARLAGLPREDVERGLTLFLAVLVELGAAFGFYFATGHVRFRAGNALRTAGDARLIDGAAFDLAKKRQGRAPLKQITSAGRRVPGSDRN